MREQATTLTFACLDPKCSNRFNNLASRSKHVCRKHPDLKKQHGGHNKKTTPERAPKRKKALPDVPVINSSKERNKKEPHQNDLDPQA